MKIAEVKQRWLTRRARLVESLANLDVKLKRDDELVERELRRQLGDLSIHVTEADRLNYVQLYGDRDLRAYVSRQKASLTAQIASIDADIADANALTV